MSETAYGRSGEPNDTSLATATGAADDEVLAALADDFAARVRRQEHPKVDEYASRHPALAERIRRILAAVAVIEQGRTTEPPPVCEGPGSTIGRYKLRERIGEGGFGAVYMAEQHQPVRRKVALKVVKPGMDSRQVLARFEAERQALAIMEHPNIARVFDGGMTDSGRPYFVMELVKGVPITEFCDTNQLPPRRRLELFAQVCHAVQHAHQKGIIHRDIKPTNVLVMMHDTTPVVKVIDFGVAKALGQELTEKTLFTGFAQLLGTPLYMSPEQAGHSGLDVDTRSDVYSLGVLLYELLTGTTPFDKERFRKAAHDEIRRIIREEEPPRPSTRLSESKESLQSISAQRHTEPAKLTRLVRGELDWIVMKALEKDRSRRYDTATGLGRDVERYLADEAVLACPPSASYRLRKFATKHKVGFAAASAVAAALVFGVAGTTLMMVRANHERDRAVRLSGQLDQERLKALGAKASAEAATAQAERDRAAIEVSDSEARANLTMMRTIVAFLGDMLTAADPGRPDLTVREMLDRMVAEMDNRQVPYVVHCEAVIRQTLGTAYQRLGRTAEAKEQLRKVVGLLDVRSAGHTATAADGLRMLGELLAEQGSFDEALPRLERALDLYRSADVCDRDVVKALVTLQRVYEAKGRRPEAGRCARRAAELRARLGLDESFPALAGFLDRAYARIDRQDYTAAERLLREGIELHRREKSGQDDRTLIALQHHLGVALAEQGRGTDAEVAYRQALAVSERVLGRNHPESAATLAGLAAALRAQRKPGGEDAAGAVEMQRLAVETRGAADAIRESPDNAGLYYDRGSLLCRAGRFREALADFDKAIELDPHDHQKYFFAAPVYLHAGDVVGYHRVCRQMARQFQASEERQVLVRTARVALLQPDPEADPESLARLIEHALSQEQAPPNFDWYKTIRGLTEYRRGRYEQAVEAVKGLPEQGRMPAVGRGVAGLVLAMAQAGAGRPEQAHHTLADVEARFGALRGTPGKCDLVEFSNWCTYQILHSEARAAVAAVSAGKPK